MTKRSVHRALISVSDKTGVVEFAQRLVASGVRIVSSGGTAAALTEAGVEVESVSDVSGAPEILGGRVKTLHPAIHGGILANPDDPQHAADLETEGIVPFELVVVNLYPFEETVEDGEATHSEAIEKIDIGGPAMIRAAAKNCANVAVVTSPDQYDEVAAAVEAGGVDDDARLELARQAFFRTAAYDAAIVGWLQRDETLPERVVLPLERRATLRYGENPHQPAGLYRDAAPFAWFGHSAPFFDPPVLIEATQRQGKEMSFNNYADAEAAWRHVNAYGMFTPAVVIVKHANACGVAIGADLTEAFRKAWACDPQSAFGSVIATSQPIGAATASAIVEAGFVEVVVAPALEDDAADVLAAKPNIRVMTALRGSAEGPDFRRISGGFLLQTRDRVENGKGLGEATGTVASLRSPSDAEWQDLAFAWKVVAHTKSNAIVIARDGAGVGIGAGDQSRIGAATKAIGQAGARAMGAVAASDAFFPFRDGLDALAEAGVTAIIEPGGSRRDDEVIAAADEHDMALVFTGTRHFLH